ncbi:MAG TPA: DUF1877 family protein [Methylocystis sp.]|nr:DUF1877 family protein [Methylocystis sp.]
MIMLILGLSPDESEEMRQNPQRVTTAFERLASARKPGALNMRPTPNGFCLDKRWHLFHYLFTGHGHLGGEPPEGALLAGREIGPAGGYGPARWLEPSDTKKFAAYLRSMTVERLLARVSFDAFRREKIYGYTASEGSEEDRFEVEDDVTTFFPALRDFVIEQAEKERGLLIKLT